MARPFDTKIVVRLAAVVVVTLVAATGVVAGGRADTTHAHTDDLRAQTGGARVRSLVYRWRSLDGSQRVAEGGEETSVTLAADVLFAFDQANLGPEADPVLADVSDRLADLGPRTVTITGHTDSVGDTAYNQTLSEQRAAAVRDALASGLGDQFTFEVGGLGATQPVAPNQNDDGSDNPEGRALNRRVEIRYANA